MAKKPIPTPEQLRQLLRYEPETGKMFWRERSPDCIDAADDFVRRKICRNWNARLAGKEAFTSLKDGYRVGAIGNRPFRAHRVIWAIAYGEWPGGEIDHIDCNRTNNRISNLREATRSQNAHNYGGRGRSAFRGVGWDGRNKKWQAQIFINGKQTKIGRFTSEVEAAVAYDKAAREQFKDYARLNFPTS